MLSKHTKKKTMWVRSWDTVAASNLHLIIYTGFIKRVDPFKLKSAINYYSNLTARINKRVKTHGKLTDPFGWSWSSQKYLKVIETYFFELFSLMS